jgi:ABC-type glycerol-3-phosphate transport system substrate-binding protein
MKRTLVLLMLVAMMMSSVAAFAEAPKFDERVTLYVTAFVGRGEPDGLRSDPVSKYIEEALNINLELTGVIESEYPTQLSAMIAANDMPDIFLFSDVTKQYPMLMNSGSLLCLEPYLEQYAPNTLADPNGQVMLEAYRGPATSPDGKVYLWGMCKGSWDDGTMPTCGHYIRWDLYKQAGYPKLESYDEDLLDVMEAMVKLEPATADGQKTYGCGAWFGDGQGWGEWVMTFGLAPQEGANLIETSGRTLAISTVDSTPINVNQMTDPNGYFWRAARFYNRANQRGLLDPDSFTQKSDIYEQKLKAGRYMFNVPGWMSASSNQEFSKAEGNVKTLVSLPSIQSDAEDRFGNMFKGERTYGVSAQTQYPERCVALLDFLSSYEFSRIAWNGIPGGGNWDVVDGKPVPTPEYLNATKDDAFAVATGANVYHHFCGYGNGSIVPTDGVAIDLYQFSPEAVARKINATILDFNAHYGKDSQVEVYRQETPITKSINMTSFSEPPEELKNSINSLNAYVGKNIFKVVAAKDDAEFEKMRDELIAGMAEYDVDAIFDYFYSDAIGQADQIAKLTAMIK